MKVQPFKTILLVSTAITLSSCSLLLPDRTFVEQMDREEETFYNPGKDFPVVGGDTGEVYRSREEIQRRTPASEREKHLNAESVSLTEELKEKEEALEDFELERYSRDKKFLQTDSDKLYYLSLTPSERGTYISSKKEDLKDDLNQNRNLVQRRSIHSSELYLGMEKADVLEVWGKPARVEIAGNPTNQNERWSFVEDGNVKQVYFEGGKVHGWALDL